MDKDRKNSSGEKENGRHDLGESMQDYIKRAEAASESGDFLLSMYLYLAAFERATIEKDVPSEDALLGLKTAWSLACTQKERALAEYIFERMEPYLSNDEAAFCAEQLQDLALDKLEEFGIPREELEEMARTVSEDILGIGIALPSRSSDRQDKEASDKDDTSDKTSDEKNSLLGPLGIAASAQKILDKAAEEIGFGATDAEEPLTYANIAGYDSAIRDMQTLGIGLQGDEEFENLVKTLNTRHGLSKMPAMDSIIIRSSEREDANRFMIATLGELNKPTINMRMEENVQGLPVLCISTQAKDFRKNESLQRIIENGGVLVLEDLDLWVSPMFDSPDEGNAFFIMQMTRGARDAINLIRFAVESPDVHVLATASMQGSIDSFFIDALENTTVVDIENPTPEERLAIWMDISHSHPSFRSIKKADLVRLSANMTRFDIYMAAREAIEQAYKKGIAQRKYVPVTRENIFEKIANYQELDSDEYEEIESEVVHLFSEGLDDLDDLFGDNE